MNTSNFFKKGRFITICVALVIMVAAGSAWAQAEAETERYLTPEDVMNIYYQERGNIYGECTAADRAELAKHEREFKLYSDRDKIKSDEDLERAEDLITSSDVERMTALKIKCSIR